MKINKDNYIKYILEDFLLPWTRSHIADLPFCFQQDSQGQFDVGVAREEFSGLHHERAVAGLIAQSQPTGLLRVVGL